MIAASVPMQVLSFVRPGCGAQSGGLLVRPFDTGVCVSGTDRWACVLARTRPEGAAETAPVDPDSRQLPERVVAAGRS